jgi:hypothetical protein
MTSSRRCSRTFHRCPPLDSFDIFDKATRSVTPALTEVEARKVVDRMHPGCEFALTTLVSVNIDIQLIPGALDAVIVTALRRIDEKRYTILAHVISAIENDSCIPFSPEVWPKIIDHLPHDQRRGS